MSTSRFIEQIHAATGPLRIRGGGSKDFYGNGLRGEVLDTRSHAGIVSYEPTELVITARCGTPLAEIEAALAEQGQMLAFEPPRFASSASGEATIGGAVASGLSGPRRAAAGAVRDYVLGVHILDGAGHLLHFGGQVMKNVAGYDVSRLMAGSLGTLALILDVSLKVLPRPAAEATLRFEMAQADAIAALNLWGGRPLPLSASAWYNGVLTLRLSGARAAVAEAAQKLGGARMDEDEAADFWQGLRDHRAAFFAGGDAPLWRIAVPGTTPPLELPGITLIEWGGGQRWLRSAAPAADIRAVAAQAGGHAALFRGGDRAAGVFQPMAPALAALNERVRRSLDPEGVFDTGRR
ncbi:MAG: glycolate oxidase subunit GlcE [Ignavibacteria bacterium]